MNRCRLAQELMYQYVCKTKVDVVLITELYRQKAYWCNDNKGDASLWVILFRGKHPDESTVTTSNGLVSITVNDVYCFRGIIPPMSNQKNFTNT